MLTYAFKSLEQQQLVWGLVTNGQRYQFVYLDRENPPNYQLMPLVNLSEIQGSILLLQVMKAICELPGKFLRSEAPGFIRGLCHARSP